MRDEAIADLSLRSEGELRQSEKCGASGMAAGGGDTNYQEFLQQRGAIITALLPTGDHQLPRVLVAELSLIHI